MSATAHTPEKASATRPRRTQQERREEAERRLIDAAAELISTIGPQGVTLAKVGELAGYSSGLVAHHFGSKSALMQRVADTVTNDFDAAMRARRTAASSLLDDLMVLVDVYFDVVVDPPPINRARLVLIADAVAHHDSDTRPVVLDADRSFRASLAKRFVRAIADGELPPGADADGLATTVVGTLRGVTFESMLDPAIDLRAVRAEIVSFLTHRFPTRDDKPPTAAHAQPSPGDDR